jgi:hypothetical protein
LKRALYPEELLGEKLVVGAKAGRYRQAALFTFCPPILTACWSLVENILGASPRHVGPSSYALGAGSLSNDTNLYKQKKFTVKYPEGVIKKHGGNLTQCGHLRGYRWPD